MLNFVVVSSHARDTRRIFFTQQNDHMQFARTTRSRICMHASVLHFYQKQNTKYCKIQVQHQPFPSALQLKNTKIQTTGKRSLIKFCHRRQLHMMRKKLSAMNFRRFNCLPTCTQPSRVCVSARVSGGVGAIRRLVFFRAFFLRCSDDGNLLGRFSLLGQYYLPTKNEIFKSTSSHPPAQRITHRVADCRYIRWPPNCHLSCFSLVNDRNDMRCMVLGGT